MSQVTAKKKAVRKRTGGRKRICTPIERVDSGSVDFKAEGLRANIDRLREAERSAAEDYFRAKKEKESPEVVGALHNEWLRTSEQLRKAEVSTPGVLSDNEETMPVEDVVSEFTKMAVQFRVAAEAMPRSLPPRLVGLDEAGIQEVLRDGVAELLEKLTTDKW